MKYLVIVLCVPLLFSGQVFGIAWKDDFEREKLGEEWTITGDKPGVPDWQIENGILRGRWPFWNTQEVFLEEFPSLDYTIQVKCRLDKIWMSPEFADAGIFFRSPGPDKRSPLYGFGINDTHARFGIAPEVRYVGTNPERHNFGEWYTMKLVVIGADFFGYVNDNLLCRMSDDRFKGNFVGLIIGANIDAGFDDFMITDQVDADALSEFSVSLGDKVTTTWAGLKTR